jgi:elongation factor P--(R)-beta-lysine ligase
MDEHARLLGRHPALLSRAAVLRAVRGYFQTQGFLEVETPVRVRAPGQEIHLDAICAGRERGGDRYLITSPEYHMKRLVASGLPRIVQICRCFRAEEAGPHHQPEFTMIEWYRAGSTMQDLMCDCEAIVDAAARAVGAWPSAPVPTSRRGPVGAESIRLDGPFERTAVRQLFRQHAGIDLRGDETDAEMRLLAERAGCKVGPDTAWDDCFYQVFLDRIEPNLGASRPVFVEDWPLPLAALARRKLDDPLTAERFELYAGGLELANAFGELTDPVEQRKRFEAEAAIRAARGKTVYPVDERLLAALSRMPPTCGIALGFDRLLMLVLGASSIREVLAFADDEV